MNKPVTMYTHDNGSDRTGILRGSRVTDGLTNNNARDHTCIQTSNAGWVRNEWLAVDLGEEMRIKRITVVNRGDNYGTFIINPARSGPGLWNHF